jgi:hypothetical protein
LIPTPFKSITEVRFRRASGYDWSGKPITQLHRLVAVLRNPYRIYIYDDTKVLVPK